jgi:hypothetical protein
MRDNFANMPQLEYGCLMARRILRRRRSSEVELRAASNELLKAVRSLRSWLSTANDQANWARRGWSIETGRRLKAERALEEASVKLAKESKLQ